MRLFEDYEPPPDGSDLRKDLEEKLYEALYANYMGFKLTAQDLLKDVAWEIDLLIAEDEDDIPAHEIYDVPYDELSSF